MFPLKSLYDQCNIDICNHLLQDGDGDGEFPEDEDTRRARAPQDFPEAEAEATPTGEADPPGDHSGDVEEGKPSGGEDAEARPG